MNRGLSLLALAALLAVGIAGGVGLAARMEPAGAPPDHLEPARVLQAAFNHASAIATKAVVHITIGEEWNSNNVGSGVIVSAEGHIVTNYHVVKETLPCRVRFIDGAEYPAKICGVDPDSDLAVLVIQPEDGRKLEPIEFADSDQMRVGDIVFAVGSPFGYTHTVTSGIVSAKHRRLQMGQPYQDFLQTDAAINPGNSGGALVNLDGRLVGVNSAMVSGTKTNDGVGLAIASNLVKWVQERLIRDGVVKRGFVGIDIFDVDFKGLSQNGMIAAPIFKGVGTREDFLSRLGLKAEGGALVWRVHRNGPAEAAGVLPFDVITEVDGRPIRYVHELVLRIVELEPGRTVKLKVMREGKPQVIAVTLMERPSRSYYAEQPVPRSK